MSELPRHTAAAGGVEYLRTVGPDTALPRVLESFELDGFSDPSAAWDALTSTWNWAASLATAVPVGVSTAGVGVRPVPGGFSLSGQWRLPTDAATDWLALPLTATPATGNPPWRGPDLFVVSPKVLPRGLRKHRGTGEAEPPGPTFRLDDVYVPAGFSTWSAGTPLGAADAAYFCTAVAGMALGAARRLTDVLAAQAPAGTPSAVTVTQPPGAPAVELAAVLHDQRLILAASLHGAPHSERTGRASAHRSLAGDIEQVGRVVHQVVAAAYEHALPLVGCGGDHPLIRVVEGSAPILQCMRFVVELLPPDDGNPTREGWTR